MSNNHDRERICCRYYWSCVLGKFVNKLTGEEVVLAQAGDDTYLPLPPLFSNRSRWYETLIETCVSMQKNLDWSVKSCEDCYDEGVGLCEAHRVNSTTDFRVGQIFIPRGLLFMFEEWAQFKSSYPYCYIRTYYLPALNIYKAAINDNKILIEYAGEVGEVVVLDFEGQQKEKPLQDRVDATQ